MPSIPFPISLWLLIFVLFAVGTLTLFLLIRHQARAPVPSLSPAMGLSEQARLAGALQHLQLLMTLMLSEQRDPSLADVVQLLGQMQLDFGAQTSLESVIQALVARDLARQYAVRRATKQQIEPLSTDLVVHIPQQVGA